MKFVSFELPSPMGPQIRTGALDAAGRIVDLAGALPRPAAARGADAPDAAVRVSAALLPGDMVALIEGGARSLDAARAGARVGGAMQVAGRRRGGPIVYSPEGLRFLPPVPRPPLLRDFMGFETHLLNIYPKLGREIPPEWYKLPGVLQGQSRQPWRARRRHSDSVVRRRRSTSSSSWRW